MGNNLFTSSTTNECNMSNKDLRDTSSFVTACSHFPDSTGSFSSRDTSRKSTSSSVSADAEEKKSRNPNSSDERSAEDFEAKYARGKMLGKGGYGEVFAGLRKEDNLLVAIKYITGFQTISVMDGDDFRDLPLEVALLLHLRPAEGETSTVVSLLDWYLVDEKLILVLERPHPCMDLWDYLRCRKSSMQEDDVKILAKQLLDCLIDVHSKGVFHRDIKPENILIETGSPVPRSRLIDFGCGTFVTQERFTDIVGTELYMSPEYFTQGCYTPEGTNVWQIGVVLFEMLHDDLPFKDQSEICRRQPRFKRNLSSDCKDFLKRCLAKTPEERATMQTLLQHPWLTTQPWKARLRAMGPAPPRPKGKKKNKKRRKKKMVTLTFFEAMKARLRRVMRWPFGWH